MKYIEILNDKETIKSFIKGLIRLSKADNKVLDEEKEYLFLAAKGLGLDEYEISELNEYFEFKENIKLDFDTRIKKLFFIREGIQICFVDGKYDEFEKNEIRLIASELNIDIKDVEKIESWVEEGMKWKAKGDELILE